MLALVTLPSPHNNLPLTVKVPGVLIFKLLAKVTPSVLDTITFPVIVFVPEDNPGKEVVFWAIVPSK